MYGKSHERISDLHYVVEASSGSKIVYRHCVCDNCYRSSDINQSDSVKLCVKDDDQLLATDLIKPCSVLIRRLNLLGHNGDTLSNCCLPLSELNFRDESLTINSVGNMKHSISNAANGIENLSEKDNNSGQKPMQLLFESLCETFSLLREKKYKENKKVECDIFNSCNSLQSINAAKELIDNLYQEKNQIAKTIEISKPSVINSTHNYKKAHLPSFKNITKKFEKENLKNGNESSSHLYEGTDSEIENEAPELNIKGMQSRYLISSEFHTNHRVKAYEIKKIDSGLFLNRRNGYSFPLACSSTKIFPIYQAKSYRNKSLLAHDSPLSFDYSNSYYDVNSKANGDQRKKKFCTLNSICSSMVGEIPNTDTTSKFAVTNEQTIKAPEKTPSIKPCFVAIKKLSVDKLLARKSPIKKQYNYSNSYYDVNSKENGDQRKKKICTLDSICSSMVGEIPNTDTASKFAVTNEQTIKAPSIKSCFFAIKKLSVDKLPSKKSPIKKQYNFLKFKRKRYKLFRRNIPWFSYKKNLWIKRILKKMHAKALYKPFVCKKWNMKSIRLKQTYDNNQPQLDVDLNVNCSYVDKFSSALLRKNHHNSHTFSNISPKCDFSNFRINNCHVLLKKLNVEDFNVNNSWNLKKVSPALLRENQGNCRTSDMCPSSNLISKNCFVLLKRIDVNDHLVPKEDLSSYQYNLKCSASVKLFKCPMDNFKIRDCFVLLERINLDEYLVKNKILNQYNSINQSENIFKSHDKRKRYKIDKNFEPSSRVKLKRGSSLKAEDTTELGVKKLKRIPNHFISEKTVKNFETVQNCNNKICDSDYKCVQCFKSITSDVELYHHLCCGKRKKGYICDVCEKIFETVPGLIRHLNHHYKFIS